jgi:cell division protein FtsQ
MNAVDQTASNRNTRADQARLRKTQQSTVRVTSSVQRAVSEPAPAARPVTVRNATFGTPVRQRVQTTNPRRQYYVALDTPGVEMRLPALPALHLGTRSISAVIAIACLVGIFSLLFSPFFAVGLPKVNGLNRLTQTEIETALDIENAAVVNLDAAVLTETLRQAYPILESVRANISLPNQVTVTIKERQPIFSWKFGDKVMWADANGVLFPATGEPAEMLTISADGEPPLYISPEEQKAIDEAEKAKTAAGLTATEKTVLDITLKNNPAKGKTDKIDPVLLSAAQKLASYFPAGMVLAYSKSHGLGWQDPGGWEVYIGKDLNSFDQKYALYQSINQQLAGQSITPAIISVEFLDAPYYRLEK